jgi:hypothetical protein
VSVAIHRGGHNHGHLHDPATLSHFLGQGVDPDVGVGTSVERAVAEGGHCLVQGLRQLGDLGLGDAFDPHRPDHVVDSSGGDPFHVALGDHGHEGPLGPTMGLDQPVREVAAGTQLGDGQIDRAGSRVPAPGSVAVPRVHPILGDLPVAGVAQPAGLGRHQSLGEALDHGSQQVRVSFVEILAQRLGRAHRVGDFHRIFSFVFLVELED